jgi:hypothetical protein
MKCDRISLGADGMLYGIKVGLNMWNVGEVIGMYVLLYNTVGYDAEMG